MTPRTRRHSRLARAWFLGAPQKNHVEGIRHITCWTSSCGQTRLYDQAARIVKKVAGVCRVQVSVYPTLIPNAHVLAQRERSVQRRVRAGRHRGQRVVLRARRGKDATASAVLSDLADAALDLNSPTKHRCRPFVPQECDGACCRLKKWFHSIFVRLNVIDRPARWRRSPPFSVNRTFGISSVIQPEGHEAKVCR